VRLGIENCFHVEPARRGAGYTPARRRIFQTVLAATLMAQDQEFDVLGAVAGELGQHLQHLAQ
jgi:hypothetical protein